MRHWLILLGKQAPPRRNHCRAQRAAGRAVTGRNESDSLSPRSISNGTSPAAFARPHFLVEFESFQARAATGYQISSGSLSHLVRLTSREQNLARLVCDGRSNQEIADEAGLSLETVKRHLHSIFCKLEVSSRSRLMALMR